jgi:DNA-binding transcriptional LysR family regulator
MKFFHMEYFLATCRSGSISKASDKLLVTRPAVSKALRELEAEYGVSLISRTTAGISLTEAGKALFDNCQKIESILEELQSVSGVTGSDQ